jgi:pilus assembly protein CpaC
MSINQTPAAAVVSILATLSLAFATSLPTQAWAAKSGSKRTASSRAALPKLTLAMGDQHVFAVGGTIARVATANAGIVGINAVPPAGVVLTASGPGTAMVSVWVEGRNLPVVQYLVTVSPRLPGAKDALGSDAGQTSVEVAGAALRLSGQLSSLESHESAVSGLAASYGGGGGSGGSRAGGAGGSQETNANVLDNTKSNFDVQVQLDVKVVEVSRSKLKEAGFYASRISGSTQVGMGGPFSLSSALRSAEGVRTVGTGTGFVPMTDAFNIFRWGANSLTVFSALENNGFAYTLAEPSLTAISGQTATFLAGGELPIPLRTGSGADAAITVDYKKFGIRLSMTPTVLDAQRMTIHVAPEVSDIDESLSVTAGGLSIPGMRVRRTETTVALADGETFVISGLVSQKSSSTVDKFPFLGDIPILGAFFRSNRFSRDDQEMLMIITPHLVRPFAREAKLPNLPGEELKDFDPGYLRFLFLENGKFTQPDSGFSR